MKKLIFIIALSLFSYYSFAQSGSSESFRMILKDDWRMQSAQKDPSPASSVSTDKFDPKSWYKVSVPTTIIGGLLANKVYDFDPFYGMNFKKLEDPALDHPVDGLDRFLARDLARCVTAHSIADDVQP